LDQFVKLGVDTTELKLIKPYVLLSLSDGTAEQKIDLNAANGWRAANLKNGKYVAKLNWWTSDGKAVSIPFAHKLASNRFDTTFEVMSGQPPPNLVLFFADTLSIAPFVVRGRL
jgi:hypothetical protein